MDITKQIDPTKCINGCGSLLKWNKTLYLKLTTREERAEMVVCPACRNAFNFSSHPYYLMLEQVDKACKGVDGYYLKTL
jgi:hypothetical protein